MIEFIVLGTIPGTSVQVTFNGVLIVASILGFGFMLRVMEARTLVRKKTAIETVSL